MNNTNIHILIIWSNGLELKNFVISDLKRHFNVLNLFNISWEKDFFLNNLKRFYAHSQKHKTEIEYNKILKTKINHCGNEEFLAIVFEDLNPKMEYRKTSSGNNYVNTNVFDKKVEYRDKLGGGHKIHASDNSFETNKDLTLLFGCNVEDFSKKYQRSHEEFNLNKNLLGVPKWKNISDLFYVLNNSIDYVVLRNFECLPNEYTIDGHGDIDLLVEDKNYIKYLTGAKAIYPNEEYRVYHTIRIQNSEVPFDFRYLRDDYYDKKWQLNILNNRIISKKGFFVPNDINYFYSLLYHALVHKEVITMDYNSRLVALAKNLGIEFNSNMNNNELFKILTNYLNKESYAFVLPNDVSVFFNKKFVDLLDETDNSKYGRLLSSQISRTQKKSFLTEVFEKDNKIIKIATNPISENEHRFLSLLKGSENFPECLSFIKMENNSKVIIERINGCLFKQINDERGFWKKKNIKKIIVQSITILEALIENDILHRDIRPENLILNRNKDEFNLFLIDFGWAIHKNDKEIITPPGLGSSFRNPKNNFSDIYSMAKSLKTYFGRFLFAADVINELIIINSETFSSKKVKLDRLKKIKKDFIEGQNVFYIHDNIGILIKKYKLFKKILILKKRFLSLFNG